MISRSDNRAYNTLRPIKIVPNYYKHADGSCLIEMGNTHIICVATLENKVPGFLKGQGKGWLTAEYGMLPKSTLDRTEREAVKGKQTGRTLEIQRLISRSLRTCINLSALGEKQIKIDCDVIQADGGTRTASISGGFVALSLAVQKFSRLGIISPNIIVSEVAAVSCGIVKNTPLLDLDYIEDSNADVDANFVMKDNFDIVDMQVSAEQKVIKEADLFSLLDLAKNGIRLINNEQRKALKINE